MKMVQLLVIRMMCHQKFKSITGIEHRRYADDNLNSSDLAFWHQKKAIENAAIDPETIIYYFVWRNMAHVDMSLAVKPNKKLLPVDILLDVLAGLKGYSSAYIKSGAQRCLVIGSETLSRVVDKR
jgi:3-oxoacyl-[acyl-carrier-protein] synthase-3